MIVWFPVGRYVFKNTFLFRLFIICQVIMLSSVWLVATTLAFVRKKDGVKSQLLILKLEKLSKDFKKS